MLLFLESSSMVQLLVQKTVIVCFSVWKNWISDKKIKCKNTQKWHQKSLHRFLLSVFEDPGGNLMVLFIRACPVLW